MQHLVARIRHLPELIRRIRRELQTQIARRNLLQGIEHHRDGASNRMQQEIAADDRDDEHEDRDDDRRHDDAPVDDVGFLVDRVGAIDRAFLVGKNEIRQLLVTLAPFLVDEGKRFLSLPFCKKAVSFLAGLQILLPSIVFIIEGVPILFALLFAVVPCLIERLLVSSENILDLSDALRMLLLQLGPRLRIGRRGLQQREDARIIRGIGQLRRHVQRPRPVHESRRRLVQRAARMIRIDAEAQEHHNQDCEAQDNLLCHRQSIHPFSSLPCMQICRRRHMLRCRIVPYETPEATIIGDS